MRDAEGFWFSYKWFRDLKDGLLNKHGFSSHEWEAIKIGRWSVTVQKRPTLAREGRGRPIIGNGRIFEKMTSQRMNRRKLTTWFTYIKTILISSWGKVTSAGWRGNKWQTAQDTSEALYETKQTDTKPQSVLLVEMMKVFLVRLRKKWAPICRVLTYSTPCFFRSRLINPISRMDFRKVSFLSHENLSS